jgi:hypothetical protein
VNINHLPLSDVLEGKRARYAAVPGDSKKLARSDILCGIEIELEDFRRPPGGLAMIDGWWDEHVEGSLQNGKEFVLDPPRNGKELDTGIDKFFDAGFRYTGGERTSVHIHTNMLDGTTVGAGYVPTVYWRDGASLKYTRPEGADWAPIHSIGIDDVMTYDKALSLVVSMGERR